MIPDSLLRLSAKLFPVIALCVCWQALAFATVASISVQSPSLNPSATTNLTSPVHFEATAEDVATITGYIVYVDNQIVFRNFSTALDAWVVLAPGAHTVYIKAWDSSSNGSSAVYQINVNAFAPPVPPSGATRIVNIDRSTWTVDNNPGVGGLCNDGFIGSYASTSDPNTANSPGSTFGQHFLLTSRCQYDDTLFYKKYTQNPSPYAKDTNFLWDFWFYVPTTTQANTVQALEFDLFQAVQLPDGVHEFMFGTQCNFASNHWQLWLPAGGRLSWVNAGASGCRFSTGRWHHVTYFFQRSTPGGYQQIPNTFTSTTDINTWLRFGTLTVDGHSVYLGNLAFSTIPSPAWSPVLGVQHQLDSSMAGATIEEYVHQESLTAW
jgi:hypothetical protein